MLTTTLLVVAAGALAGGFISGLAGFGTALITLGIWIYVIAPAEAATLAAVCSVISQTQTIRRVWHAIDARRVGPMIAAGLVGVPIGTWLLARLDMPSFRLAIGLFLIAFSAFMLLGRHRPTIAWGGRPADAVVGLGGGILGGLAGLSGPLPIMWATLRGWGKDERRGVFQAFNLAILAVVVIWHVVSGLVTWDLAWLTLAALPGTILGSWLGAWTYQRLSDRRFGVVVLCLLGFSGVSLVWAGLAP